MTEVTHVHPEDLIQMLKRTERLGAYKVLNWLTFQFTDDMTVNDVVNLVKYGVAGVGEEICNDFKQEYCIHTDLDNIIKQRKEEEQKQISKKETVD